MTALPSHRDWEPGWELRPSVSLLVLFTTTMTKSNFGGLPTKHRVIFGFFPFFLLYCLNDHIYRCIIKTKKKQNLLPLKQPQCQQSCRRKVQGHQSWHSSVEAKILQAAWREGWCPGSATHHQTAITQCWSQLYKHMIPGLFLAPRLFHWNSKYKSKTRRTTWSDLGKDKGSGEGSRSPKPAPNRQRALWRTVWSRHTGSVSIQVT